MYSELERWKLLRRDAIPESLPDVDSPLTLLRLCDEGALDGGFSVALDVTPDELVGPLAAAIGGRARTLKVLDALEDPPRLVIELDGRESTLEAPHVRALVEELNALFSNDPQAREIAILGELDRMLELWCVPKKALAQLRRAPWFPRDF